MVPFLRRALLDLGAGGWCGHTAIDSMGMWASIALAADHLVTVVLLGELLLGQLNNPSS